MLLYSLEQAPLERTILDQSRRNNSPIPDRIANAPELLPGLEMYFAGFRTLNTSRPSSFGGDANIPWHIMLIYCQEYEIEGEQRDYFYEMLEAMDTAYLEYRSKKSAAKSAAKPPAERQRGSPK